MVTIRTATAADAAAILKIYTPFVLTTAISFETAVPLQKDMEGRIEKCLQKFPWMICEVDNSIAVYVYGSVHREREAYQWTCESSIYMDEEFRGKGLGILLYQTLFKLLKQQGFVNVYGGITLPNNASIKLHEKCGFVHFATYDNVGYKFGSWHKVGWWRLLLNEYHPKPSPPLPFSQLDPDKIAELYKQSAKEVQLKLIG